MTTEGEIVNESHLKLIDDHSHSKSDSDQCILKGHGVTLMGFADPNHIIDKHDVDDDDMDVIQNDKDSLKPHDDEDDDKHNLEHDEGQDKDGDWVSNPGVTLMGHVHDTPHTNLMKHEDSDDDDDRQMDFKHNFLMGFAHENERIRYNQSDDHNWILPFLQHNALFVNNLNDSQLKHIAQSMKKRYVRLNEIVIEQDCICENGKFYMIQSGRYAAYIDDIKVRSWQDKGDIFGELSLFNDTPRAATIKCIGNGFVWYLDRKRFECICDEKIESSKKSKDKAKVLWLLGCIESNDLFKNLNFVTKTHIVEEMALIQPHYKENIILQHSIHPLTVYVVERGEYFAIIDGMRVTSWVRGGIFGELALLYDKPRSATIQCVSRKDNKLWMLDRAEFKRICDEYKDCDDDEEEKHNDALYREYICHQNVVQKKRKTTIESNVSHDSVVQKFCADDDDSYYKELFIEHAIGNVIEGDILCNGDVMDCNCLQRIGYVLSIYKDSGCGEEEEGVNYYQILNETLGEYYNTSVLCDDFYHIIATHCSANDFSILYDMMVHIFLQNKTCDAEETCVMMHRNNRIRSGNTNELYGADIVNDAQQITTKQLLDKLHCFFVHSFNNGHRVVPRIVTRRNDDNNNNNNNNKFADDMIYSFGYKYEYWDHVQQDDGLVIHKKYESLKAELLLSDVSHIERCSWIELLLLSDTYYKTNHVQKIYQADVNNRGIKRKDIISQSHLISILIYCNFDAFQRSLTQTYRKQNDEEDMASLIARHCSFYWMGRLLYESVNVYGKRVCDYEFKTFYHGISQEMYFTSPKSHIYGPLSTTNELSVAQSFGDDDGLIVVLQADEYDHNKYFDMSFISDFCAESEFFFIGGLLPMRFVNILNIKKGLNYAQYIKMASILFTSIMNGIKYKFDDEGRKRQIIHLIRYKLNPTDDICIDDYILKLFDRYCVQRSAIAINYPYFENEFAEIFFNPKSSNMIDLNAFTNLFVNLKHLRIDYIHLSHPLFAYIVDTLQSLKRIKMIQLNYPIAGSIKIEQYLTKYAKMCQDIEWKMNYDYLANKLYITKSD
eukprot:88215_1